MINSYLTLNKCCPVCSCSRLRKPSYFRDDYVQLCCGCGLAFETRIPSEDELKSYYKVYSYKSLRPCPEATQNSYQRVLQSFARWKGKARILDLGCGQGDFLSRAEANGWQPKGFEISETAVALCQSRMLDVAHGSSAEEIFKNERFDVVTAFEVLEHLRKPSNLLDTASHFLNKGGLFYLTTPNFNSVLRFLQRDNFYNLDYPGHLCIFTRHSLRSIAKRHGFSVVKLNATGIDPLRLATTIGLKRLGSGSISVSSAEANRDSSFSLPSDIDILRNAISSNHAASAFKRAANSFLNVSGLGDSLKAWLVKN